MICMAHRLQCETLRFPKHKLPVYAAQNVLKSTVFTVKEQVGAAYWTFSSH